MLKNLVKKHFPSLFGIVSGIKYRYLDFMGKYNREWIINYWYRIHYGKDINLDEPKDFDEKINWLKLNADTSLWTLLADKYAVRKYIEDKGLKHVLNEMYGVYDRAEDIDFEALPDSFVIKTTNGGGGKTVLIVKSKHDLDILATVKKLNAWLKMPVGYRYGEYHYLGIKPRLIVEKYLAPEAGNDSLTDYKFNCFNGEPYSVFLCSDRIGQAVHYSIYNLDWNLCKDCIEPEFRTSKQFRRPESFDRMIEYSRVLSEGFPFVRVDWYEIDGKLVFSELTFTPGAGFQSFYSAEYRRELGGMLKIENIPVK